MKLCSHAGLVIVATLLAMSTTSCTENNPTRIVSADEYREVEKCWEVGETQVAFMVISEAFGDFYPYLISPICNPVSVLEGDDHGFAEHLNAIQLEGDEDGIFAQGGYDVQLESNIPTHSPPPDSNDPVYVFTGTLGKKLANNQVYYKVESVYQFQKIYLQFDDLFGLSVKGRYELFCSYVVVACS